MADFMDLMADITTDYLSLCGQALDDWAKRNGYQARYVGLQHMDSDDEFKAQITKELIDKIPMKIVDIDPFIKDLKPFAKDYDFDYKKDMDGAKNAYHLWQQKVLVDGFEHIQYIHPKWR